MSYPLPGETITRTLRNVEFGTDRPRDEPAPPEIASMFRAMQEAFDNMGVERQQWLADHTLPAFITYQAAIHYYDSMYHALLRALRRRPGRCYTCDGHRFWLHVESHGCRRNVIRVEPI